MPGRHRPWFWGLGLALLVALSWSACASGSKRPKKSRARPFLTGNLGAVWNDAQRCSEAVRAGRRAHLAPGTVRLGTWNIKWFPDGIQRDLQTQYATDVGWVACVLAYSQMDVVALQEIKNTSTAQLKLTELVTTLDALTGGAWAWSVDACAEANRQHVAILYNKNRVEVSALKTHGVIDPTQNPQGTPECPGFLRPALGAYVRSKQGHADFHFLSVHLDSGRKARDQKHRQEAWSRLTAVLGERQALEPDLDVVVAGDFNLMGCEGCTLHDGVVERTELAQTLAAQDVPWTTPAPSPACSHHYQGEPGFLDQIVFTLSMKEAQGTMLKPLGICQKTQCQTLPADPFPFQSKVSDHCPVVMDIRDQDLDP